LDSTSFGGQLQVNLGQLFILRGDRCKVIVWLNKADQSHDHILTAGSSMTVSSCHSKRNNDNLLPIATTTKSVACS